VGVAHDDVLFPIAILLLTGWMRQRQKGSRNLSRSANQPDFAKSITGPVVERIRGTAMCLRFQRFQETSHLCGDELARRKQCMHAERLAEMVRQNTSQQTCFDGRAGVAGRQATGPAW
jgi:hypothetical protein